MKTYLTLWFNSSGERTSRVTQRLMSMGFRPVHGNYDHVYDWGKQASIDELIGLADNIHETLNGTGVFFKIETE